MEWNLFGADPSLLICAQTRDDQQIWELHNRISEAIRSTFGERIWLKFHNSWLHILSSLIYLTATNGRGLQTLGEEYAGLIQVDPARKFPSLLRRIMFIFFEIISKLSLLNTFHGNDDNFSRMMTILFQSLNINSLHTAFFFAFSPKYFRISKHLAGIHYLSTQFNLIPNKLIPLIGFTTLLQFALVIWSNLAKLAKFLQDQQGDDLSSTNGYHKKGFICKICSLENFRPACLPCGHVLCGNCLIKFSVHKIGDKLAQCPYCRNQFPLNRIVFALNM